MKALLFICLLAPLWTSAQIKTSVDISAEELQNRIDEGAYLTRAAGCTDCHTASEDAYMAGGVKLSTEFGDFFTPNITPDPETGLGKWTEKDFLTALRYGISPKGKYYYPSFPYRSYTKLTDEDVSKIFAYLKTVTAVNKPNRPHDLRFPYSQRWSLYFWRQLFFGNHDTSPLERIRSGYGPFQPDKNQSQEWNRGAYLAEAVNHCTECHTPRNFLGALKTSEWMAGNMDLPGGKFPNITSDPQTGLGHWKQADWLQFLESGFTPQLKSPGTEMAQVLQNTSALTPEDRYALSVYLMSLPPIQKKPLEP